MIQSNLGAALEELGEREIGDGDARRGDHGLSRGAERKNTRTLST